MNGTYTQRRRTQMAGGGITNARQGYFLGDLVRKIKDDIIPNELKNPLTAAILGGGLANYVDLIPGEMSSQNWLGNLLGNIPGVSNVVNKELERVVGGYPNPDLDPTSLPEELSPFRKALATVLPFGDPGYVEGGLYNQIFGALGSGDDGTGSGTSLLRQAANIGVPMAIGAAAGKMQQDYLDKQPAFPADETGITFQTAAEAMANPNLRFKPQAQYANVAEGGRIGYQDAGSVLSEEQNAMVTDMLKRGMDNDAISIITGATPEQIKVILDSFLQEAKAQGGRIGAQEGGLMNLGGMEKDYRNEGGFVPIGAEEKADDVPARLSKNEFVFTADAVRAAGGGDIDKGAAVMENLMDNLEGARGMYANTQKLQNRII